MRFRPPLFTRSQVNTGVPLFGERPRGSEVANKGNLPNRKSHCLTHKRPAKKKLRPANLRRLLTTLQLYKVTPTEQWDT
jgi:hypothetical protein